MGFRLKIGIVIGIALMAILTLSLIGFQSLKLNVEKTRDIIDNNFEILINQDIKVQNEKYQAINLILNADRDAYQAVVAEKLALVSTSEEEYLAAKKMSEENIQQVIERMTKASKVFDENINKKFNKFKEFFEIWKSKTEKCIKYSNEPNMLHFARKISLGVAQKNFNLMRDEIDKITNELSDNIQKINKLINIKKDTIAKLTKEIYTTSNNTKNTFIILSIFSFLIILIFGYKTVTSMTGPIIVLTEKLRKISTEVKSALDNMSLFSEKLSERTQEQASSIGETSSSLEEITRMLENNVANSERTFGLSSEVKVDSEKGNISMSKLQKSMEDILMSNEHIENFVGVIGNIGEKTRVMDDIAFKTKILSFNASIEAKRAGEHGRGFGVVAQEIGNLAQMSGQSAQEIAEIVRNSIKEAEQITSENKIRVKQGSEYVSEVSKILSNIIGSTRDVSDGSNQVLVASKEQALGINHINSAVIQLDKVTRENAKSTEESVLSSKKLGEQVKSLNEVVKKLSVLIHGS